MSLLFDLKTILVLACIATPTFLFFNWFFKKRIIPRTERRVAIWLSTIIATYFISIAVIWGTFFIPFPESKAKFSKSKWDQEPNVRYKMADNIITEKIIIGKDTSDLKVILGEPSRGSTSSTRWEYSLGTSVAGLGFMLHSLILEIKNGKVVSAFHGKIQD